MEVDKNMLKNKYLVELLCMKAILEKIKIKASTIDINEISYRVFALYWQIKIDKDNSYLIHKELKEIQSSLIAKYGLSNQSNIVEIEQILNYVQDKTLQIKLYGVIKPSLNKFSYPNKNRESNDFIITKLNELNIDKKEFFKVNKNISIKLNSSWGMYFKQDEMFVKFLDEKIELLKDCSLEDFLQTNPIVKTKEKDAKKDFIILLELEKKTEFHMRLNKKHYTCLEEALEWMNMDIAEYTRIHSLYTDCIKEYGFKSIKSKLPLITSTMLIFTAIYRYNDEDANGFWPEFFGSKTAYNYLRDAIPAMECISYMSKVYKINTIERRYLQKKNLAEIFSQIYLPETSLMKIFSTIYTYYYRASARNYLVNKIEFIDTNYYRLDKPGNYFIGEDKIKEDVFYDLVELVKRGIKGEIKGDEDLPKRFYVALENWLKEEKKEIDKNKEDYYIASPKVFLDIINEEIKLCLPKQKSRNYSDEEIKWKINIDQNKSEIPGRIIRQKDGAYLILEERFKMNSFKKTLVEYIFNNKKIGTWKFENKNRFILFDKNGRMLDKESINRDGCFLAISKSIKLEMEEVLERYEIYRWEDYIFYYLELAEYREKELIINEQISISIEDKPVIERKGFELLFEDTNIREFNDSVYVYKSFGIYNIISPLIQIKDIQIIFDNIEEKKDKTYSVEIKCENKNIVQINFDRDLPSGVYSLIIRYKDKNIYRESFIIDKTSIVKKEYQVSYNEELGNIKRMKIYNDPKTEIQPYDLNTKVRKMKSEYIIETDKSSVARFIYKKSESKVLIRQILKPIKLELTGLDEIIEPDTRNKVKEITKEVINSKDINLYIKNLDNKYKYLTYKLSFIDHVLDNSVEDTINIEFGDEFDWNFNQMKDRIIDFKNIDVKLKILNSDGNILYDKILLRIKEYIEIYNFKSELYGDHKLLLRWEEKQNNNQRKISLHNITTPSYKSIDFELEDTKTELGIDLNNIKYGVYMPLIEFKKSNSLFDSIESNIEFFERKDIKNIFINSIGKTELKGDQELARCIWYIYKEEYRKLEALVENLDLLEVELYSILSSIIQMKYFTNSTDEGKQAFLDTTHSIINILFKNYTKDELVRGVLELKGELLKKDLSYILTAVLTFERLYRLDEKTIDTLAGFDLISALLSIESGKSKLSNQIIKECKKQFDHELLGVDVIKNHYRIFDIIINEMNIIEGFWKWLIEYKNRHLLSYNYSKARLFRMYVDENEIKTFKVLGRNIDDMVDNMVDGENYISYSLPDKWKLETNIEKEIFDSFTDLVNGNIQISYIDILKAAFISVTRFSLYEDKEYFNLIMKYELSNQKEIFDRYRAYFKLIFI